MSFNYERNTQNFYQDDATTKRYNDLYMSSTGWRNLPSRVMAQRERSAVESLLAQVPHQTALDLPAGTGKLAGIFAGLGTRVVASDISASMLKLAQIEYARAGCIGATFQVEDATDMGNFGDHTFDVAVCLRLMHRVPAAQRKRMLAEFARVAPNLIVSFGIENGFHKTRRRMRASVFSGGRTALCFCSVQAACAEVSVDFEIVKRVWIAPALSQEMVFLLRSKAMHASAK